MRNIFPLEEIIVRPWMVEDREEALILRRQFQVSPVQGGQHFEPSNSKPVFFQNLIIKAYLFFKASYKRKRIAFMAFKILSAKQQRNIIEIVSNRENPLNTGESIAPVEFNFSRELGLGICTSDMPRVSVVVSVFNSFQLTIDCLRSLQIEALEVDLEVIVIDDASDEFDSIFFENIRGVKYIRLKENVGYTRATNIGATFAITDHIFLLNNDVRIVPGCIAYLLQKLEADPSVAMIGPTLLNLDNTIQETGSQIFRDGSGHNIGAGLDINDPQVNFEKEVDYCSAAALLVRKTFWEGVTGFDEQYAPAYYEDSDLGFTAWGAGLRVLHTPEVFAIHHRGASYSKDNKNSELMNSNRKKFINKWSSDLQQSWENQGTSRIEAKRESKGIVILVDHLLPSFSRDSGSIRTIRLIESIQHLGFHVCLTALSSEITPFDLSLLRRMGIEVYPHIDLMLAKVAKRSDRVKSVWLIREQVHHAFRSTLEHHFPKAGFITDLLDLDYSENEDETTISQSQLQLASESNVVVLVSPSERTLLSSALPDLQVFDAWKYFDIQDSKNSFSARGDILFVGGFGHKPNREGIFWFKDHVLPKLRSKGYLGGVTLVGTNIGLEDTKILSSVGIQVLGNIKSLEVVYGNHRVAIAPLLTGRGLKGKIAEALSFGLPVVSTKIGAEGFDLKDQECIFVGDSVEDFSEMVLKLLSNKELWEIAHRSTRDYVRKAFSKDIFVQKISEILLVANNSIEIDRSQFSIHSVIKAPFSLDTQIHAQRHFPMQTLRREHPDVELGNSIYKSSDQYPDIYHRAREFKTLRALFDPNAEEKFTRDLTGLDSNQFAITVPEDQQNIYGHWLLDIIPKYMQTAEAYGEELSIVLLKKPKKFIYEILNLFSIPESALLTIESLEKCHLNLIETNATREFDYVDLEAIQMMLSRVSLLDSRLEVEMKRKIFISRSRIGKFGFNSRSLTNRGPVEDFFLESGFEIHYPETLSIPDQYRLFSQANVVAGEAGSGLHNSIFMIPGSRVINLQSARQEHRIQSSLKMVNESLSTYIWGKPSTTQWNSNFEIDLDLLRTLDL